MTRSVLLPVLMLLALAACARDGRDYPALVPVGQLLDERPLSPDPAPALEARRTALAARAEAIRTAQP